MQPGSLRHLARNRIQAPAGRPPLQVPNRLEERRAFRRQAVLDRDRPVQMDLPFRDPDLLEFLQRLRERALAHARRHAQLVEAFRSGEEAVEDRELELGPDHLEGDHRPAAGALAGAFLLRHDFASLHHIMCVRDISSFVSVHYMVRSEEHTSELQSRLHLVCRLLLEKKKKKNIHILSLYESNTQTS